MYKRAQATVFNLIREDDVNDLPSKIFDGAIISLIIINVVMIILDTFSGMPELATRIFRYIEVISVVIFTIEYGLRLWTSPLKYPELRLARARIKYAFSFMSIVDLLAILPFYLPYVFPIDLRVLRMIRLLRILRLLKVNRYTNALSTVGTVIKNKATQLVSSMLVVLILMVMASILMYNIEREAQPEVFENALSGLWWAVETLTTVGYGDIYPITVLGRLLSAIIALLGIGLVAVPTGIISAGFLENMDQTRREASAEKIYCPYCGKRLDGH